MSLGEKALAFVPTQPEKQSHQHEQRSHAHSFNKRFSLLIDETVDKRMEA